LKIFTDWTDHIAFTLSHVKVKGFYAEFGVYKGGSLDYFCQATRAKIIFHGFDSFRGLHEDWLDFKVGHLDLGGRPKDFPFPPERVLLHDGFFADTIPKFLNVYPERAAFVHVDCDLYSSTRTVLELCKARLLPGTVIVFDEYNAGEDRAFIESGLRHREISRHVPGESVAFILE
jgi:hypothetical protein